MFKKISSLFISIILALVLSVTAFACSKNEAPVEETQEPIDKIRYTEGVHDFTAPDIDGKWLVKDGVTDYAIVLPAALDKILSKAYEEFKLLFARATGITAMTVVRDTEVTWSEDVKYISIGDNAFLKTANIDFPLISKGNKSLNLLAKLLIEASDKVTILSSR